MADDPKTIWARFAEVLDAGAEIVLVRTGDEPARLYEKPPADEDEEFFVRELGSNRPALWLSEITGVYLMESAQQLRSLAHLLRAEHLAVALEALVRPVVERVGRIAWVIDKPGTPPIVRGTRASFENLVCAQRYRMTVQGLRSGRASVKMAEELMKEVRARVFEWFSVDKPPADPRNPNSGPDERTWNWVIAGEEYPDFENLGKWALASEEISEGVAKATYGALSSFSHPSLVASREHRDHRDPATITYSLDADYVERVLRLAFFGTGEALRLWSAYYDHNHVRLVDLFHEVVARWEEIAATIARPDPSG